MRARSIIPEMDLARIFSNIEIIVDLNRDLLKRMEQRKKESPNDPNIGDLFLAHDNFFQSGYSAYCSDQSNVNKKKTNLKEQFNWKNNKQTKQNNIGFKSCKYNEKEIKNIFIISRGS